jgi:hypothetical protein
MPEIPDIDRLIAEVAARHGILLKKDDAAFALVTLNQLVLEAALSRLIAETQRATADFECAMDRVQTRAGAAMANDARRLVAEIATGAMGHVSIGPTLTRGGATWGLVVPFVAGVAAGLIISLLL